MARPFYCNITSDLQDVYAEIEQYASTRFSLKGFEVHSAGGSIYKSYNTGQVNELLDDGVRLTEVSAIASIDAVSKWYYDSTNDILYVRNSDSTDPDSSETEKGFDWEVVKTRARDKAQDEIDGLLDARFPRPIPQMRQYHATDYNYDIGLVKSCALFTCANILNMFGEFDYSQKLKDQVVNSETNNGIIDKYNDRRMRFSWETTPDELASYNIEQDASNTGTGFIELFGRYGGSEDIEDPLVDWDLGDETWQIEIDTAGAIGTATFKWSRDDGTTYETTLKATNYESITLGSGIKVKFWDRDGAFVEGDKWRIFLFTDRREDIVQPPTVILRG